MATVNEVLTGVRDALNEATASNWTNTQIKKWMNGALNDLARRVEVILKISTIPGIIGTQSYTAPADTHRIHRVEWVTSSENIALEYRDFNNMDGVWWTSQTTVSGRPALYTLWGYPPNLTITLYPKPSDAGNVKVFYYGIPTLITENESVDNTTVDFPSGWETLIEEYATYKALIKDADPRWQEVKAEYEQHVEHFNEHTRRFSDQAGMIVGYGGYGLPAWLVNG